MRQYTVMEYEDKDYQDFKNNLTDEHAITILERISRGWLPDYNFSGTETDFDNYCMHQAIYRAIEALEKQIAGVIITNGEIH